MKLYLKNHTERYPVEQLQLQLFAQEPSEFCTEPFTGDGTVSSLSRGKHFLTATAKVTYRGRTGFASNRVRLEDADVRATRRILQRSYYLAAMQVLDAAPPWGALSGVRPTKLSTRCLSGGGSEKDAERLLRETYFVSPARAKLCVDASRHTIEAAKLLDPDDLSVYIGIPFCPTRCAYCSFPGEAVGKGKLPEPEEILQYILRQLAFPHDLAGKKVLVTAGPTQEAIDPVRYLTNHSTGKMGYAIARMAMLRGADVTLVSGPTAIAPPPFVTVVPVVSAQDMFEAVAANAPKSDFIFKAAAVADYTPANYSDNKVKKSEGDMSIPLKRTRDILKYLGENRVPGQVICGFSMETQNMVENSREKLVKKNVDMICANNLKQSGAGFGVDTNVITIITRNETTELPLQSKESAANAILGAAVRLAP